MYLLFIDVIVYLEQYFVWLDNCEIFDVDGGDIVVDLWVNKGGLFVYIGVVGKLVMVSEWWQLSGVEDYQYVDEVYCCGGKNGNYVNIILGVGLLFGCILLIYNDFRDEMMIIICCWQCVVM